MSLSAAAMRLLAAKGLTLSEVIAVAEANEDAAPSALEKRRAYDRERKAKKKAESGNSTGIPPEQSADNSTGIPPEFHRKTPPLARVEDNPLRIITLDAAAVADEAREAAWPNGKAADWARSLVEAAETSRLDPMREPGLTLTLGQLVQWKAAGASWEFDVLPVITTMARKRGPPIATWKYFAKAVAQSIADNRKALEIPEASHERPDRNNPPRFTDAGRQRADANFGGAALALNRRRAAREGGQQADHGGRPPSPPILLVGG